jgi:hypothetical protein
MTNLLLFILRNGRERLIKAYARDFIAWPEDGDRIAFRGVTIVNDKTIVIPKRKF